MELFGTVAAGGPGMSQDAADHPEYNDASKEAWETNAAFWDAAQGDEGNAWQRTLVFPATERLLAAEPEWTVLEIACGNGNFARAIARRGIRVVATDQSEALLAKARERSQDLGDVIRWERVDAVSEEQLRAIAGGPFDAAVCNMAIMDMAEVGPLFGALPALLKPGAPFVASLLHPAFNAGPDVDLYLERRETSEGRLVYQRGVKVGRYKTPGMLPGIAVEGQPALQPYFHRPLELLLGMAFEAGWVLDGIEEPAFKSDERTQSELSWDHIPEIPPVLVLRLRHPA